MLRIPSILFLTCIQRPVVVYHALDASGEGDFMKRGIDYLDKGIILELQEDARRPFSVIAEKLNVATIIGINLAERTHQQKAKEIERIPSVTMREMPKGVSTSFLRLWWTH